MLTPETSQEYSWSQNEIEGAVEDIKVVWRTERKSGSHVTLRISNIGLAKEIVQKQRVNIGLVKVWSFRKTYTSPSARTARDWGTERETAMPRRHAARNVEETTTTKIAGKEGKSPLCVDAGKEAVDHSMWDGPCPTFEDRYQRRRRELGFA
ncbi:hypothetical protein MRX96_043719 [Rhipicephalus microplus]